MKFLILIILLPSAWSACDYRELRRLDNLYIYFENQTYIKRREKEPTVYRGIATTRGDALERAFRDIKEKKCPDKIER